MKKVIFLITAIFVSRSYTLTPTDSQLTTMQNRLRQICQSYCEDVTVQEASDKVNGSTNDKQMVFQEGLRVISGYGSPWLDVSPQDYLKKQKNIICPFIHSYNMCSPMPKLSFNLDWGEFCNDLFPNAGFQGAYGLLSGKWGNTQGGNAVFGDVGGYVPGTWEFFFTVQKRSEIQTSGEPLLFRPQWGFYNLYHDCSTKNKQYTMVSYAPESYMRIFYRMPNGGLNFTGAQYVGMPVSFHSVSEIDFDMAVSGPTHQLPDCVQQSESFVIIHRTIYRFGGGLNNKVAYGVMVVYSDEDYETFKTLMQTEKHMLQVLQKSPIIMDSYLIGAVLGLFRHVEN